MPSTRREFLVTATLAGAALLVRCGREREPATAATLRTSAWLVVHPDGAIELITPKLEMGQGILTAMTLLVAEELDVEPASIRARMPSTAELPKGRRIIETSSSRSVSDCWGLLRRVGAAARELLLAAAAERWAVPPASCSTDGTGAVVHAASGRRLAYGELVGDAAGRQPPRQLPLRKRSEHKRIGRPTPLHGAAEIATGRIRYTGDLRPEGLLYAVVARPPATGARPLRFDRAAAEAIPGVRRVVELDDAGVAVVAETTWHALRGRQALAVEWSDGDAAEFSSAGFARELERALEAPRVATYDPAAREPGAVTVREERAAAGAAAGAPLAAEYATPFQAHVPMEPPVAVASFEGKRCDIRAGTQYPLWAQYSVREMLGKDPHEIVVHPQRMGGSFGRKEMPDFVLEAVAVSRALGGDPVQLFWSRDDDVRHGYYHPPTRHRLSARLDGDGRLTAWHHRIASPATEKQQKFWRRGFEKVPWAESSGAFNLPYAVADLLVEHVDVPVPVRLGYWRGIEIGNNTFAVESFVDEAAHAARRDPLEFRLAHLAEVMANTVGEEFPLARLRAAYELAARHAGWGEPLPKGRGRGLAGLAFGATTACATVVEVTVADGALRVDRVVCALDCGIVINPLGLKSNAEGAVAWGLSALHSEITFERGRVQQSSVLDYPILRFPEMPPVEILIVPSEAPPTGSGEMPVPTIAPAVANAIFAATGRRLRRLPIRPGDLA